MNGTTTRTDVNGTEAQAEVQETLGESQVPVERSQDEIAAAGAAAAIRYQTRDAAAHLVMRDAVHTQQLRQLGVRMANQGLHAGQALANFADFCEGSLDADHGIQMFEVTVPTGFANFEESVSRLASAVVEEAQLLGLAPPATEPTERLPDPQEAESVDEDSASTPSPKAEDYPDLADFVPMNERQIRQKYDVLVAAMVTTAKVKKLTQQQVIELSREIGIAVPDTETFTQRLTTAMEK